MAKMLEEMQVATVADRDLLELYCVTYAAYRQAQDNVTKTGQVLIVRNDGKTVECKRNPFSDQLHRYADRLARLLPEMGLTPSSRTRIQTIEEDEANDPLLQLIQMPGA